MTCSDLSTLEIVQASPDDVLEIDEVLYQTWLATYPNEEYHVTQEDIHEKYKDRSDPVLVQRKKRLMRVEIGGHTRLLARINSRIVGVCFVRCHGQFNTLLALYVLPEYQHSGIGKKLWEVGRKHLDQSHDIFVSVAVYNHRAILFYEHLGFVHTGKEYIDERFRFRSGSAIPETEMVLRA